MKGIHASKTTRGSRKVHECGRNDCTNFTAYLEAVKLDGPSEEQIKICVGDHLNNCQT